MLTPRITEAASRQVVIVLSRDLPAYETAADAFEKALQKNKAENIHVRRIPLAQEPNGLTSATLDDVSLVFSIGSESTKALWNMRKLKATVVTAFTDFYGPGTAGEKNPPTLWLRSSLYASADDTLRLIRDALPHVKNIGILYGKYEASSIRRLKELDRASVRFGFHIESRGVENTSEIPSALKTVLSHVNVVMGLLDPVIYSPQSAQFVLQQCLQENCSFVGPSPSFAKAGAILAIYSSPMDIGKQSAQLALQALREDSPLPTEPVATADVRWAINLHVAQALKIRLPLAIRAGADDVFGEEN